MTAPQAREAGEGRQTWIVCGGRDYGYIGRVWARLDKLAEDRGRPALIRYGGAMGADLWASEWAKHRQVPQQAHFADWHSHGPAAGPMRNAAMLAAGADLVVAFPGGRGTADMVAKARAAGVEVIEVPA